MPTDHDGPEQHRRRSEFIRRLVQGQDDQQPAIGRYALSTPKTIVQFWNDPQQLPTDVSECIASWVRWEAKGIRHRLFDERSAKAFIGDSLGARHERAFERCYHPAMQADYFRLCYLLVEGGFYVDADDVCICADVSHLFDDGRLKVQPLCYDLDSDTMVTPSRFLQAGSCDSSRIFYFNNNPLIAGRHHPIIESALCRATALLEGSGKDEWPEIQATTGPGNLSKTIFDVGATLGNVERALVIMRSWDSIAVSRWPLSYRNDARNWRRSNQRRFHRGGA